MIAAAVLCAASTLVCAQGGSASAASAASAATAASASAPSNRQLASAVRLALRKSRAQGLKLTFVRVRAHNGVITLTGVVAQAPQIAQVQSVVQSVPGVTSVINKLTVRSTDPGLTGSQ